MAIYRQVHISFWQDPFVLDLTPEEKYFYLYLMTNSKTTQCGIYEIPKRIMILETGYNAETIEKLILKFTNYKKIEYDSNTNEILIKNWLKYNYNKSPQVRTFISKELMAVKSASHLKEFNQLIKQYGYGIDTVSIQHLNKNKNKKNNKNNDDELPLERFPFDHFWDLYDKKKDQLKTKAHWSKLSDDEKKQILQHVPDYVKSTPDKKYRKNPLTYLRNESWTDELDLRSNDSAVTDQSVTKRLTTTELMIQNQRNENGL